MRGAPLLVLLWLPGLVSAAIGDASSHAPRADLANGELTAFAAVNPFLETADEDAQKALGQACTTFSAHTCLRYLDDHAAEARRAIPDNPEYWDSYRALMAAFPLDRARDAVDISANLRIVAAARHWPMHELLTRRRLEADRVTAQVAVHRRLLAESQHLIDKMIFLAVVGIDLDTVNVLMSRLGDGVSGEVSGQLDEALRAMSIPERSLRRTTEEEYRHVWSLRDTYVADVGEVDIAHVKSILDYVADRSEASWDDFWRRGLDVDRDVPGYTDPRWDLSTNAYTDYASNMRALDADLMLLRALRVMYAGRQTPGIPAAPPPALWHWQWQAKAQTLCLAPDVDVHPSLGDPSPVCVPYLEKP